jgi:phosphatidylglycerol:prolipoprotein diacylglycerol transferase
MLPILRIGLVALPTYPVLLLVAFWSGTWLAAQQAKRLNINGDHVYTVSVCSLLAGIIGARFWFVLVHWEIYAPDITQAFSLSRTALSLGEGLIFAGLAVLIYLQYYKLPLGDFFDAISFGLALAVMFFHIGDFLGNIVLGQPTSLPWGITIAGVERHPVQLYQAITSGIILIILQIIRRKRAWPSFHLWLFIALYGFSRLILEIFVERPTVVGSGFSAVQILGLSTTVVALSFMAYNFCDER